MALEALELGRIVRSDSGHDAGSYYAVVKLDGQIPYIADGRRRKCANPKKKNPKHLSPVNSVVPEESLTDGRLRKILRRYNFPEKEEM